MDIVRNALMGDFRPEVRAHRAIPLALGLASRAEQLAVKFEWIGTESLADGQEQRLNSFDGVWAVPGSPYKNPVGMLEAIRYVRENDVPFLGTCGGFQHAIIEFCRNVIGEPHATHQEDTPHGESIVISALSCSLVDANGDIHFLDGTQLRTIYGVSRSNERYHCNYGLNPTWRSRLDASGIRISAVDDAGDVRAVELPQHRFYVATLFQLEQSALEGKAPPVARAFIRAAARPIS